MLGEVFPVCRNIPMLGDFGAIAFCSIANHPCYTPISRVPKNNFSKIKFFKTKIPNKKTCWGL